MDVETTPTSTPGAWLRLAHDYLLEPHVFRLRSAGPRFQRISDSALLQIVHRAVGVLADLADGGEPSLLERWSRPLASWLNRKGVTTGEAGAALDLLAELLGERLKNSDVPTDVERAELEA